MAVIPYVPDDALEAEIALTRALLEAHRDDVDIDAVLRMFPLQAVKIHEVRSANSKVPR